MFFSLKACKMSVAGPCIFVVFYERWTNNLCRHKRKIKEFNIQILLQMDDALGFGLRSKTSVNMPDISFLRWLWAVTSKSSKTKIEFA